MPNICFFPVCPKKTGDLGRRRRKVSFFRLYLSVDASLIFFSHFVCVSYISICFSFFSFSSWSNRKTKKHNCSLIYCKQRHDWRSSPYRQRSLKINIYENLFIISLKINLLPSCICNFSFILSIAKFNWIFFIFNE